MSSSKYEIRVGAYYDSVVLMQLQKSLAELPGVIDAGVVMATPANRDLLQATGFNLSGIEASSDDLLIVVKAEGDAEAKAAIGQVDDLLKRRRSTTVHDYRPRSLKGAVDALPDAKWVLISLPGRYAADVTEEALDLNKHVFLYSDNVLLEDEIRLKRKAQEKGLLLMGPDCGTAVINGTGLGFANRLRKGKIGMVAASGTGLQAVSARIHNLGEGISQAIGTGGRDLKREVGGISAQQALELLGRDPQTEVIVLVSKPSDPSVVTELLAIAEATGKPTVVNFIGYASPERQLGSLNFAVNLKEAASLAVGLATSTDRLADANGQTGARTEAPYLRALFSGGTLAYEALLSLQIVFSPIYSNIPIRPEQRLVDSLVSQAHTVLDLGEDEFTQGRLHPMMDNDLRLRRLKQETADPEVGLIMLDVVLGEGAHPDPAAELAPAIAQAKDEREIEVVAIVLGTDEDPQDVDGQIEALAKAGARVFRETADAVLYAGEWLRPAFSYEYPPLPLADFGGDLVAVNVGLESFYDSLRSQGASAIQVNWRPPAGGNEQLMAILAKMRAK
jgi:FdrA protein